MIFEKHSVFFCHYNKNCQNVKCWRQIRISKQKNFLCTFEKTRLMKQLFRSPSRFVKNWLYYKEL